MSQTTVRFTPELRERLDRFKADRGRTLNAALHDLADHALTVWGYPAAPQAPAPLDEGEAPTVETATIDTTEIEIR